MLRTFLLYLRKFFTICRFHIKKLNLKKSPQKIYVIPIEKLIFITHIQLMQIHYHVLIHYLIWLRRKFRITLNICTMFQFNTDFIIQLLSITIFTASNYQSYEGCINPGDIYDVMVIIKFVIA